MVVAEGKTRAAPLARLLAEALNIKRDPVTVNLNGSRATRQGRLASGTVPWMYRTALEHAPLGELSERFLSHLVRYAVLYASNTRESLQCQYHD